MDNCTIKHKSSATNTREVLVQNGVIESIEGSNRILKIGDFDRVAAELNAGARANYGVTEPLYTREKRTDGNYYVVPNRKAFDAIDDKRKALGIYDTQESIGSFNSRTMGDLLQKPSDVTVPKAASPKTLATIKDFLKRIGVDMQAVKEINVNGIKQDANGIALLTQKLVQYINGKEDVALPEEAMHFAVEIIKQKDPVLFRQLLKEINDSKILKAVMIEYGNDPSYQGADGKPDIIKLKTEAIGKVLAQRVIDMSEGTNETPEFLAKAETWWEKIINSIKAIFLKTGFDKAAMDIIAGKEIGNVDDIRAENGAAYLQKNIDVQTEVYNKLKDMHNRITRPTEEDGQYSVDGTKKIDNRVSDFVHEFYSNRFNSKELTQSEYDKELNNLKKDKGTGGHNDMEYMVKHVFTDDNGFLLANENDDSGYVSQLNPEDRKAYDVLKNNLRERLHSFGPDARFLAETMVYNPNRNGKSVAGTIDLIAIRKDGRMSLLDWKFADFNTKKYEDVPWFKVKAWNLQMDEYKSILTSAYGISPQSFEQARMIPIKAEYSQGNRKAGILPTLLSVEIGDVNVKNIKKDYLIPVGIESETTGKAEVDELLKKLRADYDKISSKTAITDVEKANKREQLNALFTAIRQLQMRQNIKPLLRQATILNKNIRATIDIFEKGWVGTSPDSYTDKQLNEFSSELGKYENILDTYTTLDIALSDIFPEQLSKEDKELKEELRSTVDVARYLQVKLDKTTTAFTRDFVGKKEIEDDVTKPEKTIKGLARLFYTASQQQSSAISAYYLKTNRAFTLAVQALQKEHKKLEDIREAYVQMARAKGLTNKNYFDLIRKKGKNALIDEFDNKFYDELENKIAEKDFDWIKANVDLTELKKVMNDRLEKELNRIDGKDFIGTADEVQKQINIERAQARREFDIDTPQGAGWLQYDFVKKAPNRKIWESKEWKELNKSENKAAKDFYDYIREKNEEYESIGYIGRGKDRTFLPWIRKGLVEKLAVGGQIKLGESFLRAITVDSTDVGFGSIDPHTGQIVNTIPKYFTREFDGEYSEQLFETMTSYNAMALKFKYLADIEEQARLLLRIEQNKEAINTSIFGKSKYDKDTGKLEYINDNSRNSKLLENMINATLYGQKYLQDENFDFVLGKVGTLGKTINEKLGVNIFPENLEGKQISGIKMISALNSHFQRTTLGFSLLAPTSNLFGGTSQAIINAGKYYTKRDYMSAETWINAKMLGGVSSEARIKHIGALDYFLPLTENYSAEFAKKLALSKLNQQNIQDALMYLMRQSDKHVQTVNFISFIRNTIVQDGKLVNTREYLRTTPEYSDMYAGTDEDRKARKDKFEKDVERLNEEQGVLKVGEIKDGEFHIPGVEKSSESVLSLRRKIQQVTKDALGSMTEDDKRELNMTLLGNSASMFKGWIPRLVDVRLGAMKYNSASDAYEWGRLRAVFSVMSPNLLKTLTTLKNSLIANQKGVDTMRELYEKKKVEYEKETGKELRMSSSEFMDMYRRNVRNSMYDALFMIGVVGLYLAIKANAPDKDEDPQVKNVYKFMLRASDKLRDEITYFYDPSSFSQLITSTPFPAIQLITNFEKAFVNFNKEMFGLLTGNEDAVKNAHVIKYIMKEFPIANQLTQYLPMIAPNLAKELDIKAQSTSGFAR